MVKRVVVLVAMLVLAASNVNVDELTAEVAASLAALPVRSPGQAVELAVATTHQGRSHAKSLLAFALRSAVAAASHVGSYAVITHPLDDQVRAFYARFHFEDLPGDPKRAMFVRISELAATGFAP